MTSKEAVNRIMVILGLKSEAFYEAKTAQGLSVKMEGDLELGQPIYVATEEGMIPAPPGVHVMDDGTEIEVDDAGMVAKIKAGPDAETEEEDKSETTTEEGMSEAELEFGDVKLVDGGVIRLEGEEPSVGLRVMKVGYDGTLSALHDGEYETSDGKVLQIVGGSISGVQSVADNAKRKTGFAEAKDKSGLLLSSPSFQVGDEVKVINEDGTETRAKDQSYDIEIDGEPHTITVTDGLVAKVDKARMAEGPEDVKQADMEAIANLFAEALKKIENKIDAVASKQEVLENKFQKFSKEPGGNKVYTQKTINEEVSASTKYEGFRKLREALAQK